MIDGASAVPEICVIGRTTFGTGIATLTYAMCELLSRSFPICVLPTESAMRAAPSVSLPNGRLVPVLKDPGAVRIWIFCDVLWNGTHDTNYTLVPDTGLRIAYVVFDSDELPLEWVEILNRRFDLAVVTSPHLENVVRDNGVDIPVATLSVALDLEPLLGRPFSAPVGRKVRFLSVSAFHPRKEAETLIRAFMAAFGNRPDAQLTLHSNLAFGDDADRIRDLLKRSRARNIHVSHAVLSEHEKNRLIERCDVFVSLSRGEGYAVGPREALALGKPLVLSAVGGHLDLDGIPGVFLARPSRTLPARYLEIDNRIFGRQHAVDVNDAAQALLRMFDMVRCRQHLDTCHERRAAAANFAFSRLSTSYAELVNTDIRQFRRAAPYPRHVNFPRAFMDRVTGSVGPRARSLSHTRNRVVQMHDGGFFSIFNVFVSHLVWDLEEAYCHRTLPDWDVGRMIERNGSNRFTSFCYGRPEDRNIWTQWFQPLFGLTGEEMNDRDLLYENASLPTAIWNEDREPLLTYVHAYRLYQWKSFPRWRRQYHSVFRDHIRLRPELAARLDAFTSRNFDGRYMIAAHVRHPSHGMEQPGLAIAHTQSYIDRIGAVLRQRGIDAARPDWGVFLATDQESVVSQFQDAYGDKVFFFDDVRRTAASEDAAYEALPAEQRVREGHQVQHIVASTPEKWSSRMGWEVIRDAMAMSRCNTMLHVVSNVSTAVSYMNPDIELMFTS